MPLIVVGYDGSDDARRAVRAAAALFEGAALLVHVWNAAPPPISPAAGGPGMLGGLGSVGPVPPLPDDVEEAIERRARETVDEGAALAAEAGLAAEPVLVRDPEPWRALLRVADERSAHAIVVGRRGVGRLESALLGSASNGLTQHAHLPVVVVPPPGDDA